MVLSYKRHQKCRQSEGANTPLQVFRRAAFEGGGHPVSIRKIIKYSFWSGHLKGEEQRSAGFVSRLRVRRSHLLFCSGKRGCVCVDSQFLSLAEACNGVVLWLDWESTLFLMSYHVLMFSSSKCWGCWGGFVWSRKTAAWKASYWKREKNWPSMKVWQANCRGTWKTSWLRR